MNPPILNLDQVEFHPWERGDRFSARLGPIGRRIGAQRLGYNLTVVHPGKAAFPFHNHHVNEEMFFILEGEGELRLGEQVHPLRQGDVIACPPGGPESAHMIRNTSSESELRYLAVSTMESPELAQYPDSAKYGFHADLPPAEDGAPRALRFIVKGDGQPGLDAYWEGEA